jgi:carbamoyl-phosphate synthase small subunit
MNTKKKAKLILEDGSEFLGWSFGADADVEGEVVFNTGMVGYPETMTDPSFCGQILVLVGNYGVPGYEKENCLFKYFESEKIQVRGIVISDLSENYFHWNANKSLSDWMSEQNIPGIYGIDTRRLTKKLRRQGTMLGKITYGEFQYTQFEDPNKLDLVSQVGTKSKIRYDKPGKRIVLVDCGVKNSIIQAFLRRNITVIRVPYDYDFLKDQI